MLGIHDMLLTRRYGSVCVDLLVKTQRDLFACTNASKLVSPLSVYTNLITISNSQASKAVDVWKADLTGKKCPKIAVAVVHPNVNPESFEEC